METMMGNALLADYFIYLLKFITDPKFQWDQAWVRWVAKKCSVIHENIWTGIRIPGAFIVIWVDKTYGSNSLTLLTILFFVLTDWIDGKVVLAKGKKGTKFGSIYDGVVDRIFIAVLFYYFGISKMHILAALLYWPLVLIETASYIWLRILERLDKIKDKANFYEHLNLGKYKFGIQVCLGIMLWAADAFCPDWRWWPLIVNVILGVVIIFAVFAAACKYRRELINYFADGFTLMNAACGIVSCWISATNLPYACMLVNTGAGIDFLDGYVARKTKTNTGKSLRGVLLDSVADIITFGLAPAVIAYFVGVHPVAIVLYVMATGWRLVHYMQGKVDNPGETDLGIEQSPKPDEFNGYPSTAAGIVIANLVWCGLDARYLNLAVCFCAVLEVSFLFKFKWYHFKNIGRLKRKWKVVPALTMLGALIMGKFNLGMVLLMIGYTSIFFKPISSSFFSWKK